MNRAFLAIVSVVFLLTGCAGMRVIDNQVDSFAPQRVPVGASYRFDRLPSQQADAARQAQLEAMTEAALAKVGLKRKDTGAELIVQVSATQRMAYYAGTDGFGWGLGFGYGIGHGSFMLGHHDGVLFPGLDTRRNYWREVRLVLREQATSAVVFETRADHDGPWADSDNVLPAMLDAALQGFPNPPEGVRRVNIEISR